MNDSVIVFCTCADESEAQRIANTVIHERLAACVNVLSAVRSIYQWQGRVESAHEIPLMMKTTLQRFPALRDRIVSLHSYDTPEIVAVPIAAASEKYLSWLRESVTPA